MRQVRMIWTEWTKLSKLSAVQILHGFRAQIRTVSQKSLDINGLSSCSSKLAPFNEAWSIWAPKRSGRGTSHFPQARRSPGHQFLHFAGHERNHCILKDSSIPVWEGAWVSELQIQASYANVIQYCYFNPHQTPLPWSNSNGNNWTSSWESA